jgi:hypothetical protein
LRSDASGGARLNRSRWRWTITENSQTLKFTSHGFENE